MNDDLISRAAAIDILDAYQVMVENGEENPYAWARLRMSELPSAQQERIQNNALHLCDSCQYTYVTCPSHGNDAVFGDGKGNDNICACNKYRPISAQPEITDEQAIVHLQASGWMQSHDKQMYEMGLKERLADDSDSYDALLPSSQPETNCSEIPNTSDFVSRKAVREMVATWSYDMAEWEDMELALHDVDELPPVSAERK